MSVIDSYIKRLQKKFPRTKEVGEQLEEIRDTLHAKTEELQATGMRFEDAEREAIRSAGDMSGLLNMVAGETREVYVNRLNMAHALIASIIITVELLFGFAVAFGPVAMKMNGTSDMFSVVYNFLNGIALVRITPGGFWPMLVTGMIAVWIWPVTAAAIYKRNPLKTEVVRMSYKRLKMISLLGWAAISLLLFAVNMATGYHTFWFVWPMVGISNWPVNVITYHKQLTSGKFDAQNRDAVSHSSHEQGETVV